MAQQPKRKPCLTTGLIISSLWLLNGPLVDQVLAQSIVPSSGVESSGTVVVPQGTELTIQGGQRSRDGANLFHSFQRFGLDQGQIANFLATPQIRNILGRVTGGERSLIDGLVRVSGGQANLYLMNPAGIVFGANARLDVPAAFTATTASGIGFDRDRWFNATGSNDYASLVGIPRSFAFTATQPGAIANFGVLTVPTGASLTLLGGTILNAGTLAAPDGQITLAAVPGQTLVRLSQPGSLVSLEFQPLTAETTPNALPFTPVLLPQLLTGGSLSHVTQISFNADGTVQLSGSTVAIPTDSGTAIASGSISVASTTVSTAPTGTPSINVLGAQVGVFNARLDASSGQGGGLIRIGGDYQGQGSVPNATFTYVSPDSTLRADGLGASNGGRIIAWADDSTRFYGHASAQGGALGGNGGLIETSGHTFVDVAGATIQAAAANGQSGTWLLDPHNVRIVDVPGGIASGGSNPIVFTPTVDDAIVSISDIRTALNQGTSVRITTGTDGTQAGNITLESPLFVTASGSPTLSLEAVNDIYLNQSISSSGVLNISLTAGNAIALNAPIQTDGGNFTSNSRTITGISQINTNSSSGQGQISITTANTSPTSGITNPSQINSAISRPLQNMPNTPSNTSFNQNSFGPGPNGPGTGPGTGPNGPLPPRPGSVPSAPNIGARPTQSQGEWRPNTPQRSEQQLRAEFLAHFRPPAVGNLAVVSASAESTLNRIQAATGVKPALVYMRFAPSVVATRDRTDPVALHPNPTPLSPTATDRVAMISAKTKSISRSNTTAPAPRVAPDPAAWLAQTVAPDQERPDDQLEIILVTAEGVSVSKRIAGATREQVLNTVHKFISEVADPRKTNTTSYLAPAQKLYHWLITPIESELQAHKISNLTFIADTGLRFIPMAALHDGHQFLIEKYSVGLMPTLSLTDTRYVNIQDARVLAAGASKFASQPPLPAVPLELSVITQKIRQGESLLNDAFTLSNLKAERQRQGFRIIHLATHGEFQGSAADAAYIQLWDTKLKLDQLRDLGWNNPPVELLVLSACRTAIGNDQAELGFAGFALQAGVKTALASLWYISDEGTPAFMSEFYTQLRTAPIKAEALRQTQIAMLRGKVKIENHELLNSRGGEFPVPASVTTSGNLNLTHPFYWAAFTLVGSPW